MFFLKENVGIIFEIFNPHRSGLCQKRKKSVYRLCKMEGNIKNKLNTIQGTQLIVVIVDTVHWIFVVRADKIKPLFTPKV
jgi:hypothetical protein